jgi:hypothetical protein
VNTPPSAQLPLWVWGRVVEMLREHDLAPDEVAELDQIIAQVKVLPPSAGVSE